MLLVKKCQFCHYLCSLKITPEIRFNNVLKRKEPFFTIKKKKVESPKIHIFPEGLTHAFGQTMPNFSLFGFGQNKTRKNAY